MTEATLNANNYIDICSIPSKGVYRVSIVKRPLFSTSSNVFAFYDFIK